MKTGSRVLAAVSAVILLTTLISVAIGLKTHGKGDSVEATVRNSLPLRSLADGLRYKLELLTGSDTVNGVYSSDDSLFRISYEPDNDASFADASALIQFADLCESKVYFLPIPTSYAFSEDKENDWNQRLFLKEITQYTSGFLTELDIYSELNDAFEDSDYYRTEDTWSPYGAYIGYRKFCTAVGLSCPDYSHYSIEIALNEYKGDISARILYASGITDRIEFVYDPDMATESTVEKYEGTEPVIHEGVFYRECVDTDNPMNAFLGPDCGLTRISTGADSTRSLLIIGDDSADILAPYFQQNYAVIDLIRLDLITAETAELADLTGYDEILIVAGADSLSDAAFLEQLSVFS